MKKKVVVILMVVALIVPCFGSVSASCPACGGPATYSCTGTEDQRLPCSNYVFKCPGEEVGVWEMVECMFDSSHSIFSGTHSCYCTYCTSYITCPY